MSQRPRPSIPGNRTFFVVQFRLPSEGKPMVLEGLVEHLVSGQAQRFESQEQLWAFITRVLTALQSRSLPSAAQDMEERWRRREPCGEEREHAC